MAAQLVDEVWSGAVRMMPTLLLTLLLALLQLLVLT